MAAPDSGIPRSRGRRARRRRSPRRRLRRAGHRRRARRRRVHPAARAARAAAAAVLDLDLAEPRVRHRLRRRHRRSAFVRPELLAGGAGHRDRHRGSARSPRACSRRAGPSHGVPQMVLSRLGFGYWGNVLPAGLNSITAGIGWFAVNSVSGTFALNTLTHLPKWLCLVIIVVVADRDRVLRAQPGAGLRAVRLPGARDHLPDRDGLDPRQVPAPARPAHGGGPGGFLLTTGRGVRLRGRAGTRTRPTTRRYFPPDTSKTAIAWWSGAGAVRVLRGAGDRRAPRRPPSTSAGASLGNPTGAFTGHLPTALADLTLLAIALGAVARERAEHLLRRAVLRRHGHQAAAGAAPGHRRPGVRRDRLHRRADRPARRGHRSTRTSC